MPQLRENNSNHAVSMLQAGVAKHIAGGHFENHQTSANRKDNHFRYMHLRNRVQTACLTAFSIQRLRLISPAAVIN